MSRFFTLRRLARYSLLAFLLFLLGVSAILWYVTTDSFQQFVRHRLIAAMERASGGRVELGSFHVVPLRFEVEVRDVTIHGRESAAERPLLRVDSMSAVVDLSSALGAKMSFRSLVLVHPVVHIIFYPDGSTNRPKPLKPEGATFDQLFAIAIHRLEVRQGELFVQEQRVPIEFVSNDVEARLNYSFLHLRYYGDVSIGKAETQISGYRPVVWAGKTEFTVSRNEVQLPSFSFSSERSSLHGQGKISDIRNPIFTGKYDINLDLQQAAAVLRQPGRTSGLFQVRGMGSISADEFDLKGDFDLKDASVKDRTFTAAGLYAAGKFSANPQEIVVSHVQGRAMKGTFSSELDISGWRPPPQTRRELKQVSQRGTMALNVKDISLTELFNALGPDFSQVKALKLAGALSGSSQIRWKDSVRNADVTAAFDVVPPSRRYGSELPVSASAHFRYRARPQSLDISDFVASAPATLVRATGTLSDASSLRISLATGDIVEWSPLTAMLFPSGLPVRVRGRAAFNGNVTGSFRSPVLIGNLQLQDFDAAIDPQRLRSTRWDSLTTDLQVSAGALLIRSALFRRGEALLTGEGSLSLRGWRTQPGSAIHFTGEAQNFNVADLSVLPRQNHRMTGILNSHFEIAGTISAPQAKATLAWSNGTVDGYAFDSLRSSLAMEKDRVTFQSLEIAHGSSHISGKGWYDVSSHAFDGESTGTNFDLAQLMPLENSRVKLSGRLDYSAKASGTLEKPDVNAHVHLRDVAFNDDKAGALLVDAVTHGTDMLLTGRSEGGKAELQIEGDVHLRELWPAHINFHFARLDIDSLLETYLHGHVTGHSAVAGDLLLEGPLRDPHHLTLVGTLSDLYADLAKVQIRNDGPLTFAVNNDVLRINSLHLIGENTDLSGSGTVQLSGERQLNLRGAGKIGVQMVQSYDPDLTGAGTIAGNVRVTGTMSAPNVRGTLQVQNVALADVNLPSALSDLNGTLQFSQNQITISKLTGRTGGGTVDFTGNAQLTGKEVSFDLSAAADSVRFRYPPGVSSTATANLRWSGTSSGSLVSGNITVTKIGVTPGFDFGAYLERSVQSASLPQTDPVLNNIRLDLHVVTTPELQMQTSVLRLRGDADLRVRGSAAKPVLLGRADVFEGEAYFNGTKYRLERGGVSFGTPTAANAAASVPFVDLQATTHVRDYDITLSVTGPADRPKLNYRSEPPLPTNDIIGLLAFGQTTEESAQLQQSSQSAFSQQASNAMLAAALNATLNNRTQRLFGSSRIKIDPQGLETETSPTQSGPAVTIEQQVKDNLTLTYTTNVAQTSQQIIRAEYYVSRNVSVVAIRDQNGVVSFDVRIRRRKR